MTSLDEKVEHALDENRILVLGVQVLLGFQFESFFQQEFGSLPGLSRALLLAGLFLLIITLALLLAPVAYHRLVRSGEDTADLHRYITLTTGSSLFPFAAGMATGFFVAAERIAGFVPGLLAGSAALVVALFFWYGLALIARRRHKEGNTSMKQEQHQSKTTPLDKKIDRAFTETRIVLPGAQALLGFQFLIILTHAFSTLPDWVRVLHMASLASVGIATILLMAPAAYHRIVEEGEDSTRVLRFTSSMVLAAMLFIGLGISGDAVVVLAKVTEHVPLAVMCGTATLLLSLGLWFGFSLYRRREYQNQ